MFSILVTWVLENGVTTADSMAARGYGRRRRTHFQLFRFRSGDAVILLLTVLLFGITAAAYALGALAFSFYPTLSMPSPTPLTFAAYGAYACMALLPSATEIKEKIKWKYLQSKM